MLHNYPDFYKDFHCLAAACPDACCYGWEVVVDETSAVRFRQMPGALGQELREVMVTDEDGDLVFRLKDGRCPFWNREGLCRIELAYGHEAPCETCRKFPRLTQDYGVFIDHGLTLACPEAARLILTHRGPWVMEQVRDDAPTEDMDGDWLACVRMLQTARAELLTLLWAPDVEEGEAMALVLDRAQWYDTGLQGLDPGPWEKERVLGRLRGGLRENPAITRELLELYRGLDILTDRWAALLDEALRCHHPLLPRKQEIARAAQGMGRNLWTDCLYRYWLQAADHGDCITDLMLAAVMWHTVLCLAQARLETTGRVTREDLPGLFQLYAKEVEHDEANRESLLEALSEREWFTVRGMEGLLRQEMDQD